jgi:acyl-CoA dehydrogenase
MSEELEIFRSAVKKFYAEEFAPHEERWARQQMVDRAAWFKAARMGILCASIPQEYGGAGGSFAHEAVILEEQARALISSFGNAVHSGIVAHYLLAYASAEQKRKWLPKMASGEMVAAIAMSEPGAGSDLRGIKTRARREGDRYVLNGSKTFISNGYHADLMCVAVKTAPGEDSRAISLLMVETRDLAGFRRGRLLEKIGQKGQDTAELFFDEASVPVANLLGAEEGLGLGQLMQQLPQERLIIAIQAAAAIESAVEITTEYVKGRSAFGKALMEFQNTRFTLAECKTEAVVARTFVDSCIERHLAGRLDAATASMAKWWTTQKQCEVIDACLQLHGGYGYMLEYPIARMYADARVQKIYGGANEILKELIARSL